MLDSLLNSSLNSLLEISSHPVWLVTAVILGTYILEDVAIISTALLCADGMLTPLAGFVALIFGIYTGDLGLYGLGRLFQRWQPAFFRKRLHRRINQIAPRLQANMISVVLLVRLIPGLRLPSYVGCGFFRLSFAVFNCLVLFASGIWTALVFWPIYFLGVEFWEANSTVKWWLLAAFIIFVFGLHRFLAGSLRSHMDVRDG